VRSIPLVGVSLAVFQKHKKGFPRYKDKGTHLSNTINKFLRENDLLETDRHSAYGLRHSFEDRMKDAGVSDDLRRELMGHAVDRPKYGKGYTLAVKQAALLKMTLPFDRKAV
jgi:integrase